jgi:mono/diheme cytochrome c family protein
MAQSLPSPPRDLSTPSYQSQVSDEELLRIISEGKGAMPGAGDVLSAEEVRDVLAFVRLLSPGYELYDRFCAVCHGPDGHPPTLSLEDIATQEEEIPKVVFDQTYFRTHADEQVRAGTQHMLKQSRISMPHFAGEISADAVQQILTYLRTLPPEL